MKLVKLLFGSLLVIVLLATVMVKLTPQVTVALAREIIFTIPEDNRPEEFVFNDIKVQTNIEYTSLFSENTFDYYEAKEQRPNQPTILWIHGGGFVGGDKTDAQLYAIWLAYNGYNVIAMNYELVPTAMYPSTLIQMNELIGFLQLNGEKWNINMDQLYIAGDSAGAQMAAQFTILQTNMEYAEAVGVEPVLSADQIKGVLLYCGIYDLASLLDNKSKIFNFLFSQIGWSYIGKKDWANSEEAQLMSIIQHVDENFPNVYITDGNTISFEEQGKSLVQKLESHNVEVVSRFFDEDIVTTYHGFQFRLDTDAGIEVFKDTIEFLSQ